jgi:outer membrane protein assembly factor BamB
MKKIVNISTSLIIFFLLVSCGSREFLGFEEKKIKLKGKRVAILQLATEKIVNEEVLTKIILSKKKNISSWDQSYNSPSHLAINFEAITTLSKPKRILSGSGETADSRIFMQPVVNNNNLFFLDARANVISFNLKKNKVIWKKSISLKSDNNHNLGGGVAIYNNQVIINSPYGEVIALDKTSGSIVWRKNIGTPFRAAPTIFDNKIFSLALSNKLIVLNADDGSLYWEHQGIFNNTTLISSPKLAINDNIVIVPYSNGDFFGINIANGKELWRNSFIDIEIKETSNFFTDIDGFPVIKKNTVIMTNATGKITAVNMKTGSRIWEKSIPSITTPAVNGNSIFIINNNLELICLDINNGGIRWKNKMIKNSKDKLKEIWQAPVIINSKLVLVGGDKKLIIVDPFTGEIEGVKNISGFPASSPFIYQKKVYLMLRNGDIIHIE